MNLLGYLFQFIAPVSQQAAVKASSLHNEALHHLAEMSDRIKQLEYELGGEKAKVAELEDKMDGMADAQVEVVLLQKVVSELRKVAAGEEQMLERKEAEVGELKERFRELEEKAKFDAETADAEIEMLHNGEGLDYEKVTQSTAFTPVFAALRGIVVDSVRATLLSTYPGFNFGPLDEALKPKPATIDLEKEAEGEMGREKTPSSQGEKESQQTATPSGEEEAQKDKASSKETLNAQEQAFLDGTTPPFP